MVSPQHERNKSSEKQILIKVFTGLGLAIGIYMCVFIWQAIANDDTQEIVITQDISKARVDTVKGIRILHLYGSSTDMGEQHGRLLKQEIHTLIDNYLHKFIGGSVRDLALYNARSFFLPNIPKAYVKEMRALAKAAGVDFETVLLAQCFLDINRVLACSTIALDSDQNALGEPLLLRNLDFPSLGMAEKHSIIIVRHPHQGKTTVTVGWPLLLGTLSGFNSDGLSLAMMEVYSHVSNVKAMPYNLRFRHCLEHCATTEHARLYFANAAITSANNLTCLDKHGDSAVFELTRDGVVVRNTRDNPLFATNHFVSPELNQQEHCHRFKSIETFFKAYENDLDLKASEQLLDLVAIKTINLQSFIIMPESQQLHISLGKLPASEGPFVSLDKKDLGLETP